MDPRFTSVLKLMNNTQSRYLRSIAFGKVKNMTKIYRGGAMSINALIGAIKARGTNAQSEIQEEAGKKACLDMVGW